MTKRIYSYRYWEIDFLRGTAVIMMIASYFMQDLLVISFSSITDNFGDILWIFTRVTGALFFLLMGISLVLSYNHAVQTTGNRKLLMKFMKRGAQLFGVGIVISLVTKYTGNREMIFGALHLIGFSILISYPLINASRRIILFLAALVFSFGIAVPFFGLENFWLSPFGFMKSVQLSAEYFPIFPWYGFSLLGLLIGRTFYPGGKRHYKLPDIGEKMPVRKIRFLGRHALAVYLVYQPVLYGIVLIYSKCLAER